MFSYNSIPISVIYKQRKDQGPDKLHTTHRIHILGSGTCIPTTKRGSSSYLVSFNSNKILFDCGNGATWKLEKIGINYLDIDHIFITHLHPDHNSDLIPFLFATKYPSGTARTKPLHIWGPKGFKDFFNSISGAYNRWIEPDCLKVLELECGMDHKLNGFSISCLKTPHTDNSLAYKLQTDEKVIVYSGDTDYTDSLADLAHRSDVLIIECSFPDRLKKPGHLTPSEVIRIANLSKPRKLVLTHLYPICDEENVYDLIKNNTDCEILLGEDLLQIDI